MEQTTEITLKHPIPYGETTLAVLKLRRPKAADFRGLKGPDKPFDMILDMAARLSDITPAIIDRIDGEDVQRLVEVVGGFLGLGPATGKT
jgi:hypothetical protein